MPKMSSAPWPRKSPAFPILSKSGTYRGYVIGPGGPCASHSCDGEFLHVDWEFGYFMKLCTKGIEFREDHYRIVDGGEISARFVNPVDPPPLDTIVPEREHVGNADWSQLYAKAFFESGDCLVDQVQTVPGPKGHIKFKLDRFSEAFPV